MTRAVSLAAPPDTDRSAEPHLAARSELESLLLSYIKDNPGIRSDSDLQKDDPMEWQQPLALDRSLARFLRPKAAIFSHITWAGACRLLSKHILTT